MKEIFRTSILTDAYALQADLEAHGIACSVFGEHSIGIIAGGVRVMLHDEADLEPATELVRVHTSPRE